MRSIKQVTKLLHSIKIGRKSEGLKLMCFPIKGSLDAYVTVVAGRKLKIATAFCPGIEIDISATPKH